MADSSKIQFIICANDRRELEECTYYIRRLCIPQGMQIEITVIEGASSMASGYNCGMAQSNAQYRIYLHQDTCLIYTGLLDELVSIFQKDATIGMVGVVGAREIPPDVMVHSAWDIGRVDTNCKPLELNYQSEQGTKKAVFAEAIDGLFMATQYDLPWREDLFKKWDFYDISQSLEMKRQGCRVVVPYQKKPWCWHDNETSKLADYEGERRIFSREYQDIKAFVQAETYQYQSSQAKLLEEFQNEVFRLVDCGAVGQAGQLLGQYHSLLGSRAELVCLENICFVRQIEQHACSMSPLYGDGMKSQELLQNFREDKFLVKRMEYGDSSAAFELLKKHRQGLISREAVFGLAVCYVKDRDRVARYWYDILDREAVGPK